MEPWKDIPGYVGRYQVNPVGQVKSLGRLDSLGRWRAERIMKATINNDGYCVVELFINGRSKCFGVHALVALAFIDNPQNFPCINHINTVRSDNAVANLEWCTYSHNNSHAHRVGAQKNYYGENHHQSKLTKTQVQEIRAKYRPRDYSISKLAAEYNISKTVIQRIIENKIWKQIA